METSQASENSNIPGKNSHNVTKVQDGSAIIMPNMSAEVSAGTPLFRGAKQNTG